MYRFCFDENTIILLMVNEEDARNRGKCTHRDEGQVSDNMVEKYKQSLIKRKCLKNI